MTRGGHHRDERNYDCTRCGLPTTANHGMCPPGFWMTEAEQREWFHANGIERRDLEIRLGSQLRTTHPLSKEDK